VISEFYFLGRGLFKIFKGIIAWQELMALGGLWKYDLSRPVSWPCVANITNFQESQSSLLDRDFLRLARLGGRSDQESQKENNELQ